jgi:hypothetical protein
MVVNHTKGETKAGTEDLHEKSGSVLFPKEK